MQEIDQARVGHSAVPPPGKIASATFRRVIRPRLGAPRQDVLVGPQHGVDVGVIDIGNGQVMAVTSDPFFVMPRYGWERAAWFAVHIVASDICTSGLSPAFGTIDLNLPPEMTDEDLEALWIAVDDACRGIGMAIVTGHTGRYTGCSFPMLGGMAVMSRGARERYLTPAMARVGDAVIVTKGAAIETTGMFGATFPRQLTAALGPEIAADAENLFGKMSVVADALAVVEVGVREGGVTAMHDATERGVWGGLVEIAEASGVGLLIDREAVLLPSAVRAVCGFFDIDPFSASSEGTLLLTCRPQKVGDALDRLAAAEVAATVVGEVVPPEEGVRVVIDGATHDLSAPVSDPFWPAFERALEEWDW